MSTNQIDTAIAVALEAADANAEQTVSESGLLDLVLNFAYHGVLSGALLHVPGIHARGDDLDADLTWSRLWIGYGANFKHLSSGSTVVVPSCAYGPIIVQ